MSGQNDELLLEDEALRDGLQQEARILNLNDKLHLFQLLQGAGVKRIQIGSFVSPKAVPQMADTEDLINVCQGRFSMIAA